MSITIAVNDFAKRQVPDSEYSHFDGTWDELIQLVQDHFDGSDEGIVALEVPADRFFSGVAKLSEGCELEAKFDARRKGEEPYVQFKVTNREKLPAVSVKIILYSHAVLAKDGDNSTNADWEIISVNASASAKGEPMTPVAMARNFLGLAGGTKREYTAEQFAESIIFWSQHAMTA